MDPGVKSKYESESHVLRADLKKWENDWAKANGGGKPGREDIKRNAEIAQKYKQYSKLREVLAGKLPPPMEEAQAAKRKAGSVPSETPIKRAKYASTPSKNRMMDGELMNSPAISRKLFSPGPVTSLGPTPQRDGRVLGLFDLMVEKELGTPSKRVGGLNGGENIRIEATPSKRRESWDEETAAKLSRTPMSASKRQMLNTFLTPLKNKEGKANGRTPTSVSKLQFDTPAFLKRYSLPILDENDGFDAPAPLRLPRKPLVRGLSEIVASLRKVEEDKLDDDMEALHEAENEQMGRPTAPAKPQTQNDILVEDSQARQLPLSGFDEEEMYDSPVEEQLGRDGNPMRLFKKKGQKRTTRRVNMRPTRTKRPITVAEDPGTDNDDDDMVPETQPRDADPAADILEAGSDSEFEDIDAKTKRVTQAQKPAKKDGAVTAAAKKTVRKVNELAHANFHRLKLRNHGAKGGPGYSSKFRRRR